MESNLKAVASAVQTVHRFIERFNERDVAGMDDCLAFPHCILLENKVAIWDGPGALTNAYFDHLQKEGWHHSELRSCESILARPKKVHLLVAYSRVDAAGRVLSEHHDVWIVVRQAARWAICLRSY